MENIKSEITDWARHNGAIGIPFRLTIHGSGGHGVAGIGGRYKFVAAYMNSTSEEKKGMTSLDIYCENNGIPFWHGETLKILIEKIPPVEELRDMIFVYAESKS